MCATSYKLIPIKKQRKEPKPGDVFITSPEKSVYFFGKVLEENAKFGMTEGDDKAWVVCIFDNYVISDSQPKDFPKISGCPLFPPQIVSKSFWTMGYFNTIGHQPVTQSEQQINYGFYEPLSISYIMKHGLIHGKCFYEDRYVDAHANKLKNKPEYISYFGLSNHSGIAQKIHKNFKNECIHTEATYSCSDSADIELYLNARLLPTHRGVLFEEPIDRALKNKGIGEVSGGATYFLDSGEPEHCEITIKHNSVSDSNFNDIMDFYSFKSIPKGSHIIRGNEITKIGALEGMAIYLNGTDLEDDIYKSCDINYVIEKVIEMLGEQYIYHSYWEGKKETALYFYGSSFLLMKESVSEFIKTYPLCQHCRIIQTA